MGKEVFGEFAAFATPGGVRFMQNNKMVSENAVPPEVVTYLKDKIATQPQDEPTVPPAPKFPRPSEEELARMRAESLQVPDELKLSPEEEAQRQLTPPADPGEPLSPEDFDEPSETLEPTETPHAPEPGERMPSPSVDPSFMETVSIHTATLKDIAQAMYDRFGIYSVYLNTLPQNDEVNPLTGEQFTKYHLGIAYQAAISAQARGIASPETFRGAIDEGRAASANVQDQFVPVPRTMGDARRADSFDFRTSVQSGKAHSATEIVHVLGEDGLMHAVQKDVPLSEHGGTAPSRFDAGEDEMIIEPPIFGTKPIIKPNW